jgi:hypothetical protein
VINVNLICSTKVPLVRVVENITRDNIPCLFLLCVKESEMRTSQNIKRFQDAGSGRKT